MTIYSHKYDLPDNIKINSNTLAIDTEAMGLNNIRDRLCTIQICDGSNDAHVIHFPKQDFTCTNLRKILQDNEILKIFHFARFDVAIIQHSLSIDLENIFCTKIASRLVRTYTDFHGLRTLCDELLNIKISKTERASDWGMAELSQEQINYAANDVLHLHKLMKILQDKLKREGREKLAEACFKFIPTRAKLDVLGWGEEVLSY
jgi:ribonuclease D